MPAPQIQYVDVGDAEVAYRTIGDGPVDLCLVRGLWHIDITGVVWEKLASSTRLIYFDRRGTGASDALPDDTSPTSEQWTDDLKAVLDAVGSERTSIYAAFDGGPIGVLFAATHPSRVSALILSNTAARGLRADDYPIGYSAEQVDYLVDFVRSSWGTPAFAKAYSPSRAADTEYLERVARDSRAVASRRSASLWVQYVFDHVDVRPALPMIQSPTLVLHNEHNPVVPLEMGRYLAEHIEGAKFFTFPEGDAFPRPAQEIEEIAEFITGTRPAPEIDRVLSTVMFTDIVASTQMLAGLGDTAWRSLLEAHNQRVRQQLQRFSGREIKTTGDGFLASFDGTARAIMCARAITQSMVDLGIEVRIGIHAGECEIRGDDLGGITVHTAARVVSLAGPNEVLVSAMVRDLVAGSGIDFEDRGEHELKGVPGTWRLFAVEA